MKTHSRKFQKLLLGNFFLGFVVLEKNWKMLQKIFDNNEKIISGTNLSLGKPQ